MEGETLGKKLKSRIRYYCNSTDSDRIFEDILPIIREHVIDIVDMQRLEKPHHRYSHWEDLSAGEAIEEIMDKLKVMQ